ncbi:hypothetical protein HK104_003229 [Borealophlyctis nickersoniae]|nr:hypothetical protein HK104_003229 [Borealophlyctis nickersoniae]
MNKGFSTDNTLTRNWTAICQATTDGMTLFHASSEAGGATTFADYLMLTRLYLQGHFTSSLNAIGRPYKETTSILSELLDINRCGILTVSSQPGVLEPETEQRPYFEGFVEIAVVERALQGLGGLAGKGTLCHVKTVGTMEGGGGKVLFSNSQEVSGGPRLAVTREWDAGTREWVECTFVGPWDEDLQEVEQFFRPRYGLADSLAQVTFASIKWGEGKEWFANMRNLFGDACYTIVDPFSESS